MSGSREGSFLYGLAGVSLHVFGGEGNFGAPNGLHPGGGTSQGGSSGSRHHQVYRPDLVCR